MCVRDILSEPLKLAQCSETAFPVVSILPQTPLARHVRIPPQGAPTSGSRNEGHFQTGEGRALKPLTLFADTAA
jgi:hypothetical protein